MTPNQRARKAKRAFDAYEIAYNAAMELLRDEKQGYATSLRIDQLTNTHRLFLDLRREADFTALVVAEADDE